MDASKEGRMLAGLEPLTAVEKIRAKAARALRGEAKDPNGLLMGATLAGDGVAARQLVLKGHAVGVASGASRADSLLSVLAKDQQPFGLALARFLLDAGALDPLQMERWAGSRERSFLSMALEEGNFKLALAVMRRAKRLPSLDTDKMGPVAAAAKGFHTRAVWALPLPMSGGDGELAQAEEEFEEVLGELARLGADFNQRMESDLARVEGGRGSTALRWVADSPKAVELLLAHGVDPNLPDARGSVALMWAASAARQGRGSARPLRLLLDAGADPLALDARGRDALGWLASRPGEGALAEMGARMGGDLDEGEGWAAATLLIEAGLPVVEKPRLAAAVWSGQESGAARPAWMGAIEAAEERLALGREACAIERGPRSPRL